MTVSFSGGAVSLGVREVSEKFDDDDDDDDNDNNNNNNNIY